MKWLVLTFIYLLLLPHHIFAQEEVKPEAPKTKLGAFSARNGLVIIQGFSPIGTVKGIVNTSVIVEARELTDVGQGLKLYGLTIEVKEPRSGIERDRTSFVDYEEIESLVKGLDYIVSTDKTVTKLGDYQAQYSTKDDLKLTVFSGALGLFANPKNPTTYLSIESGTIGKATAYIKKEEFSQFRDLIVKAKEKLDSIK